MATMRKDPYADPAQHTGSHRPQDAAAEGHVPVQAALRKIGRLPARLTQQVKTNPGAALATVAAASFFAGALFGTRLGRLAMTAALGYGIKTMVDRGVLADVGRVLQEALLGQLQK